nr:complement decay-accelerating factor isoform X2 [Dasypus novemcinctus]
MSPAWRSAPAVLGLLGGLALLLLCPPAVRGDCGMPPKIPNAEAALQGLTRFPQNSTVTYKCNQGFYKIPDKPDTVLCLESNKWSEIKEFCNRSCNAPTKLRFASLKMPYIEKSFFPVGSTVEYDCRPGYKRIHTLSGNLTCLPDLTWSKPAEFCNKKACPNPGEIKNGQVNITTNILFGSRIFFSCDKGYKLVGSTFSYCTVMRNGSVGWNDPLPECQQIFCPEPPKIDNGKIQEQQPNYVNGQSVTYTCAEGFILTTKSSLQCVVNDDQGEWSGQRPECKESPSTIEVQPTTLKPTTVNAPATEAPTPQKPTTVKVSGTTAPPPPQKPTTAPVPEAPPPSEKPTTAPATETPQPSQKPTTVNAPATEAPPPSQKPTTVNAPATEAPPPSEKPTTAPATEAPQPSQKPTTVNAPASEAPPPSQKPTTVNAPATEAPPPSQKPTTAPATEAPPPSQKPTTVNAPATEAPPPSQKPTTAPASEAPPPSQKPTIVNAPSTKAPPTPQKPTTANASVTKAPATTQKKPTSKVLSTETPLAALNPVIANTSATQATPTKQRFTITKASFTHGLPAIPKSTTVHAPVTKSLHTTQRITSSHIKATKDLAVPRATTRSRATSISKGRGPLPSDAVILSSGFVAGTLTIGCLILVKIFCDYGKSGFYNTHENNNDVTSTVTGDDSELRLSDKL